MVTSRGDVLTEWASEAACRSLQTDALKDDFFGVEENASMSKAEVASARFICRSICPVARECLKAALSGGEGWGVWGGYTAAERARAVRMYRTTRAIMDAYDDDELDKAVIVRGLT